MYPHSRATVPPDDGVLPIVRQQALDHTSQHGVTSAQPVAKAHKQARAVFIETMPMPPDGLATVWWAGKPRNLEALKGLLADLAA